MDRLLTSLLDILQGLKKMDKRFIIKELRELLLYINKQVFRQIPSLSAIGGILVGAWVSSNFTTSPIKGVLATFGLIQGGRHVVSSSTYAFLSVVLPIFSAATTAYLMQKTLKHYRRKQLDRNIRTVSALPPEIRASLDRKLGLLEKVREAGIVSENEYLTKRAALYQSYSTKTASKLKEIVLDKLS